MNPLVAAAFSICAMHYAGPGHDPGFEKCSAIYNADRAQQHDAVVNPGTHWQDDLETVQKAVRSLGK